MNSQLIGVVVVLALLAAASAYKPPPPSGNSPPSQLDRLTTDLRRGAIHTLLRTLTRR